MKKSVAIIVGTLAAMSLAQAQGSDHGASSGHAMGHGAHAQAAPAPSTSQAVLAYQQVNDDMHAAMAIEYTGDADVDFMQAMIPHHQGAIDMARVVLSHGQDPQVRKLAEEVITAQEAEIAMMRQWLADRGR